MFNWLKYWLERNDYTLRGISQQFSNIYAREYNLYGPNSKNMVTINMTATDFGYLTAYLEQVTGRQPSEQT